MIRLGLGETEYGGWLGSDTGTGIGWLGRGGRRTDLCRRIDLADGWGTLGGNGGGEGDGIQLFQSDLFLSG